ncbi:MAG: YceD family protein [Chthoniobacteraceae bacterium]
MKIHLNQIPLGNTLHIEGEEDHEILAIQDEIVRVLSPVRYSLDVGVSEGGLFATGSLSIDLELQCVRCLTPFPYTLEIPDFALQIELGTSETVDLTEETREDILLALPPHPHCDWDGANRCAGVLKIEESEPAPEPGKRNPWAKLDQLVKPKADKEA